MDEIELLKTVHLFNNMDDQEVAGVRSIMTPASYVQGQIIIREGDEAQNFHVIMSGQVQFFTSDADGNELILDEAGPGDFFGELSMLTDSPRLIRVKATSPVRTLMLDRAALHEFLLTHSHAAIDLLTVLANRLYKTDRLLRQSVSRNVNDLVQRKQTFGQRVADGFAALMGSWTFIIVQTCILIFWVTFNLLQATKIIHWDEYPFIFLNLALSFQAAYAAPIIMMSQNRSAEKDRLAAEIDHQVNVKAEIKTGLIVSRLDDIEREMHALHEEQLKTVRECR